MQITIVKLGDGKWHGTNRAGTYCGILKSEAEQQIIDTKNVSADDTWPNKNTICLNCWPKNK